MATLASIHRSSLLAAPRGHNAWPCADTCHSGNNFYIEDLLDPERLEPPSCGRVLSNGAGDPLPPDWIRSNTARFYCIRCWQAKRNALPFVPW